MANLSKYWNRQALPPLIIAFVIGVVLTSLVWGVAVAANSNDRRSDDRKDRSSQSSTPAPSADADADAAKPSSTPSTPSTAQPSASSCSAGKRVSTADELQKALDAAQPGTTITLAPGVYTGNFVASVSGTASAPISLCGDSSSILDGDDTSHGYVFHLDGASYWHLQGFTIRNGQKGLMADGSVGSVIDALTVTDIGDEGIHLRKNSTDNLVTGNTVHHTGLHKSKFGEGIYIGTAKSNWCDISDCKPDNSDRNVIEKNVIFDTTSENVDIKEGTTGGTLRGNSFDGSSITAADSWVDVKGNDWTVDANSGKNSPMDGFQTHEILDGWGTKNVFSNNISAVNGPGFGIAVRPALDNIVECNNTATGAASGESNIPCTGN